MLLTVIQQLILLQSGSLAFSRLHFRGDLATTLKIEQQMLLEQFGPTSRSTSRKQ